MSKLIRTFTVVPKQLFRLNNGSSVFLRDRNVKLTGRYDVETVDGNVKPKALDPKSYAAPNGASLRPNTSTQQSLVSRFKASNIVVYAIPAGIQLPDDLVLIHEQTDHYSLQAANLEMGGLHSNMEAAVSNGATFMPNTFTMQEFIRMSLDEHLEKIEGGKFSSEPVIYSVRKGTPVPSALTLFRLDVSQFSLQPSSPVSLKALNNLLDEFYTIHAEADTVGKWLASHAFEEAHADDAEAAWMDV